MHPTLRRAGWTLTPACLLVLLALFAATTGFSQLGAWASQASATTATTAEGLVATGSQVSFRGLLPSGAGAGLLLVASGLVVLAPLTSTLLLGGALRTETRREAARPRTVETAPRVSCMPARPVAYRGPRDEEFRRGRLAGARMGAQTVDELMDRLVETEMGEPRILRSLPNLMRVQLQGCRGCGASVVRATTKDGVGGCAFECGLLEGALEDVLGVRVVVHEVACRGQGAAACEFEVWY